MIMISSVIFAWCIIYKSSRLLTSLVIFLLSSLLALCNIIGCLLYIGFHSGSPFRLFSKSYEFCFKDGRVKTFVPSSSLVAQRVKRLPEMQETWVQSLGQEDPLEKGMATHSRILAWEIPWTEEPSRLQFMGLQSQTRLSYFTSHLLK